MYSLYLYKLLPSSWGSVQNFCFTFFCSCHIHLFLAPCGLMHRIFKIFVLFCENLFCGSWCDVVVVSVSGWVFNFVLKWCFTLNCGFIVCWSVIIWKWIVIYSELKCYYLKILCKLCSEDFIVVVSATFSWVLVLMDK